ncbi:Uncharacterized protein OBRU01_01853 [Operophtera brumata]|uniref:Uncharacterized protein n=1 Tax=Operophtera brumata TaxID=104452 RepID=A0A0L7LTF5_OPEBR|nr:Uncharacterized protein OBRU01_01853 [Operophtera brumata]
MLRRADCYIELNQHDHAVEALSTAKQHALTLKLTTAQNAEFDRHVNILERKMEVVSSEEMPPQDLLPDCYKGEGDEFTAASSVLELRRSDTVGRYVVTREASRRGDVLFSEEPYAWVPLPCELPLCDGCCAAHINLVPVLLISTINGFPDLPASTPTPTKAADLFAGYANTSTMLILYLEHFTSFFEHLPGRVPYELGVPQLRLFAGALMLRALGQLVCNGHAALTLAVVLNCYGPHRARDTTSRRRQLLRAQYLFTCSCSACLDMERRDFVVSDFSKSVELIKQNIQSLEYQFGSFSVEAVQLMDLNYGSWEPLVKRLKEQEALVATLLADSKSPETSDNVHHMMHYNLKI